MVGVEGSCGTSGGSINFKRIFEADAERAVGCWWGRFEGKGIQGAGPGIAKYVGFCWDGKRGYQIKGISLYGKI